MRQNLLLFMLLMSSLAVVAQKDQWTWVNGDTTLNAPTIYSVRGLPSATATPGARTQTVSWSDASGNLWLFGGYSTFDSRNFGIMNDLWKYTPATGQWTWVNGDNIAYQNGSYGTKGVPDIRNKPGARINAVGWTDALGNLWLFGGNGYAPSGGSSLNDLWRYTPATNIWTWMGGDMPFNLPGIYGVQGVPAAANKPGARTYATTSTDPSGNLWLFGGEGFGNRPTTIGYLSDVWKYTPSTGQWTWMGGSTELNLNGSYGSQGGAGPLNRPGGRYKSVSWSDASGNFWLFGGFGLPASGDLPGGLNDLWKFVPATGQWIWVRGGGSLNVAGIYGTRGVAADANQPSARERAAGRSDASGKFYLFGGVSRDPRVGSILLSWNDLWQYDPATNRWTWVSGDNVPDQPAVYGTKGIAAPANKPSSRSVAGFWLDPAGTFWLYGGDTYPASVIGRQLGDLWKYNASGSTGIINARKDQQSIVLNWTAPPQQNLSDFTVERYSQSRSYDSIGVVAAVDATYPHSYSFTDKAPIQGMNFYRIRQRDHSGTFQYSATAQVSMEQLRTSFAIIGNPVQTVLRINFQLPSAQQLSWQVSDLNGHILIRSAGMENQGSTIRSIGVGHLARGTYLIEIETEGFRSTKAFVKQ